MNFSSHSSTLPALFRIAVGLCLALVGVTHYMNLATFVTDVNGSLGMLTMLGTAWAYVLPALQIIGGLWFAFDGTSKIAGTLVGVVFLSIAVGMLLKVVVGGAAMTDVMGATQTALLWMMFAAVSVGLSCSNCDCSKKNM